MAFVEIAKRIVEVAVGGVDEAAVEEDDGILLSSDLLFARKKGAAAGDYALVDPA